MGKVTEALSNAGSQITSDFKHATGIQPYTDEFVKADYDSRTANTIAVNEALASGDSGSLSDELKGRYNRRQLLENIGRDSSSSDGGSNNSGGDSGGDDDVTSPADMYAENKRRYDEFKAKQKADAEKASRMDRARRMYEQMNRGAGPIPRQMQGLGQFENPFMSRRPIYYPQRQQTQPFQGSGYRGDGYNMGRVAADPPPNMMAPGTGGSGVQRDVNQPQEQVARPAVMPPYDDRMPMLPMPQPMPQNQATSPAFRYAGQNYGRLGGQQRMYDRPQEMMSQRERQGVNRIYDGMQQPVPFYSRQGGQQQGIAQLLQNALANKGGGRTAPQPQMPRYQTMPYQRGQGGLPSIGGKGAGRTMPQRPMRGSARGFGGASF